MSDNATVTFTTSEVSAMKQKALEVGVTDEFFIKNSARARLGLRTLEPTREDARVSVGDDK